MSKHLKTAPIAIPVERLTTGTIIYATGGDFWTGAFAEVLRVSDGGLGEDYAVTCQMDGVEFESLLFVPKGGAVTFGGIGAPVLRPESDISATEWAEKAGAEEDAIDRLQGRVAQNVDAQLVKAVADAVGVPALQMAAE